MERSAQLVQARGTPGSPSHQPAGRRVPPPTRPASSASRWREHEQRARDLLRAGAAVVAVLLLGVPNTVARRREHARPARGEHAGAGRRDLALRSRPWSRGRATARRPAGERAQLAAVLEDMPVVAGEHDETLRRRAPPQAATEAGGCRGRPRRAQLIAAREVVVDRVHDHTDDATVAGDLGAQLARPGRRAGPSPPPCGRGAAVARPCRPRPAPRATRMPCSSSLAGPLTSVAAEQARPREGRHARQRRQRRALAGAAGARRSSIQPSWTRSSSSSAATRWLIPSSTTTSNGRGRASGATTRAEHVLDAEQAPRRAQRDVPTAQGVARTALS